MKLLAILFLISLSATAQLSVETFNAGLAHTYVPLAKERIPHVIADLKEKQSDVLCLQEVWKKEDRNRIIKELKAIYPHSFHSKIKQVRTKKKPSCKVKNLFGKEKFVSCTLKKCKGRDGDDFTSCVLNECSGPMETLKNENRMCANALLAQVGRSSLSAITQVLNPFKGATLFAYGGGDGLLILSKKGFANKEILDFTEISTLNKRAALVVELNSGEKVACTHLTANLSDSVAYAGKFSSWKEENAKQIERLVGFYNKSEAKTILAGDFNCAFGTGGLEPDWEDNCQKLLDNGFKNDFIFDQPVCTYCSTNTLNSNDINDILIDHIFVKNASVEFQERSRENLISIEGEDHNLSDHYGLRAIIE
jgi:endonuclease/exonuclease/phosphatase family metal-dependent hydrolase